MLLQAIALSLYDRVTAAEDEELKPYRKGQKTLNRGAMQTSAAQYGQYVADASGNKEKVHARVAVCKQFFNTGKIGVGDQDSGYLNM